MTPQPVLSKREHNDNADRAPVLGKVVICARQEIRNLNQV